MNKLWTKSSTEMQGILFPLPAEVRKTNLKGFCFVLNKQQLEKAGKKTTFELGPPQSKLKLFLDPALRTDTWTLVE